MIQDPYEKARLIEGYLSKKLSDSEEYDFLNLMEADPQMRELLKVYEDKQMLSQKLKYLNYLDINAAYKNVSARINEVKPVRSYPFKFLKYAASIIIGGSALFWAKQGFIPDRKTAALTHQEEKKLADHRKASLLLSNGKKIDLTAGISLIREKNGSKILSKKGGISYEFCSQKDKDSPPLLYNTLSVPKSANYRIQLSDGTVVWINNQSALTFPVSFGKGDRAVSLVGEAYFEVTKDSAHPFKINVNGTEIAVLGTKFNVKAFSGKTYTTLVEGVVKLTDIGKTALLKPGQQGITGTGQIEVIQANLENVLAWKKGYFSFNEDTIQSIMDQLSRWYDLDIHYITHPAKLHYTANISRTTELREVLETLEDITGLQFDLKGRTLTVKSK